MWMYTVTSVWGEDCQEASAYLMAEYLYVLVRSVMYNVNPCMGEGGEEELIVSNVADDM